MKKLQSLFIFAVIFAATTAYAQQVFNVQNGTKTEFYNELQLAIDKAVSGDTIYLPGAAIFVEKDLVIDKKLALIGAGWDIDSIGGLGRTELKIKNEGRYLDINFREGADGSLLTGCVLRTISFGYKNDMNETFQKIENITIARNYIYGAINLGIDNIDNEVKNIFIRENVIDRQIQGFYARECWINNNLLAISDYAILSLKTSRVYNNVFRSYGLVDIKECIFENNFITGYELNSCTNCTFNNNAFVVEHDFPVNTNTGINNLFNQETIKTFNVDDLTLPKNLEVRDTSPCKNAGTDGKEIGIYGGSTPYKKGAMPFNPHIDKASIAAQTDKDGNLKVDIQVSAQTK